MKLKTLVIVFLVLTALVSCGGGGTPRLFPVTLSRYVIIPNIPTTPQIITTEFRFVLEFGKNTSDFEREGENYWTKAEIDYGDGGGWIDYTQAMSDYHAGAITQNELPSHIYTEPGTYTVRARVTYWDGEVYESTPFNITVLPPDEGDGA